MSLLNTPSPETLAEVAAILFPQEYNTIDLMTCLLERAENMAGMIAGGSCSEDVAQQGILSYAYICNTALTIQEEIQAALVLLRAVEAEVKEEKRSRSVLADVVPLRPVRDDSDH
jgi:hypothetical protein